MKIAILGATGRTGRSIVELSLAAGHDVTALCRKPDALAPHPRLKVVIGDVHAPERFREAVLESEVVISALGPSGPDFSVCSIAAERAVENQVRRYVSIGGAGVDAPGDKKGLMARVISRMIGLVSPKVMADKVRELAVLSASTLDWTLVRPPRLVDGPPQKPVRVTLDQAAGTTVGRGDLARFCLEQATDRSYTRRAPFVAW